MGTLLTRERPARRGPVVLAALVLALAILALVVCSVRVGTTGTPEVDRELGSFAAWWTRWVAAR